MTMVTLADIDQEYTSIGCLGQGGFGSVFLAEKKSGRKVALKFMQMDTNDDEEFGTFVRELDAVVKLNKNDSPGENGNRDLAIVYFEGWFIGRGFVCIVMNYCDGGTLAQEIERKAKKSPQQPYSERRIAWYALQLCEALAYAHEKGVTHHDVKAANVLIDASAGGRLLLADFGTSIAPGEESVGFTKSYAPPELLASHELDDYADLRPDKIDSFGLGCILFEVVTCSKLEDLSCGQTLAEFIAHRGVEAALTLGCMKLPWLPPSNSPISSCNYVGYSHALKSLIVNLLKPNPEERWLPSQLQAPLRNDPLSPLLSPNVVAAQTMEPGSPVTIDNLQLGMFVQRGPNWNDEDADGGIGSIGVVAKLDADGQYVEAAFPCRPPATNVESICCRIGAGNKYELQVGPMPILDYYYGSTEQRWNGIVFTKELANFSLGQRVNQNCMVVGLYNDIGLMLAAPMERKLVPTLTLLVPQPWKQNKRSFAAPREHMTPPSSWQPELGLLVEVTDTKERSDVLALFYDDYGGLKEEQYAVDSIQRVQDTRLWEMYSREREVVALENWGMRNETRAFHGAHFSPSEAITSTHLLSPAGIQLSEKASIVHDDYNRRSAKCTLRMILARITLGRVFDNENRKGEIATAIFHSDTKKEGRIESRGTSRIYPEYIITYRDKRVAPTKVQRRIIQAVRPPGVNISAAPNFSNASYQSAVAAAKGKLNAPPSNNLETQRGDSAAASPTKLCVICWEKPVHHILVPCGHPIICDQCCNQQVLRRLKGKCPECRQKFTQTAVVYGRIVND